MRINGLQKLTLLDYPGHTACTVFTAGCNYRCPFCQNSSLVLPGQELPLLDEEEFFRFLRRRQGLLDGVCITGGEPTLHQDLPAFAARIRELGFAVKLDTNGTNPAMLRRLLEEGLLSYAAMDIKAAPENYPRLAGTERCELESVRESAALLMAGSIDFEFRTTVVRELHSLEDFEAIGQWLAGSEKYFLQAYRDSDEILGGHFSPCSREEMEEMRLAAARWIPAAAIRGMD